MIGPALPVKYAMSSKTFFPSVRFKHHHHRFDPGFKPLARLVVVVVRILRGNVEASGDEIFSRISDPLQGPCWLIRFIAILHDQDTGSRLSSGRHIPMKRLPLDEQVVAVFETIP